MLPFVLTAQLNSEKLSQGSPSLQNSSSTKVYEALFARPLPWNIDFNGLLWQIFR